MKRNKNRDCKIITKTPEMIALIKKCDDWNKQKYAVNQNHKRLNNFLLLLAILLSLSLLLTIKH